MSIRGGGRYIVAVHLAGFSVKRRESNTAVMQQACLLSLCIASIAVMMSSFAGNAALWVGAIVLCFNAFLHARYISLLSQVEACIQPDLEFLRISLEVGSVLILGMALAGAQLLNTEAACLAALAYLISLLCPIIKCNALKRSAWKACYRMGLWARLAMLGVLAVWLLDGTHLATDGIIAGLSANVLMLSVSLAGIVACAIRAIKHSIILSGQDPTPLLQSVERDNAQLGMPR
jgi:hypothetical protein